MQYTLEEIYDLVGREDKTAMITFRYDSVSFEKYGGSMTVVFEYTQKEREELDELIKNEPFKKNGFIKTRYLGYDRPGAIVEELRTKGINSEDISSISYFDDSKANTFHSTATRAIKTFTVKTTQEPKGRDYDWMYGFKKRLVQDGVGLNPRERQFYLAGKLYYEPGNLTENERKEMYFDGEQLSEPIEWELLSIKYQREEITPEELKRIGELVRKREKAAFAKVNHYLIEAGSSMKKLAETNLDKAAELMEKTVHFKDRRIGVGGEKAIYINVDSFLHIYMRHVEEMKVSAHFEDKDNFQWKEEDVFTVIKHVIEQVHDEIQDHFRNKPNARYSRYGKDSLYFEGDYYTFHIETDGNISTFHKNKKTTIDGK